MKLFICRWIRLGGMFAVLGASQGQAEEVLVEWQGGSGDWSNATNWSPAQVPNNATDTFAVSISQSGSLVWLDQVVALSELSLGAGSQLRVENGRSLRFVDASFVNDGLLQTLGTTTNSSLFVQGVSSWSGTGTVRLGNDPQNRIVAAGAVGDLLNNHSGHTIAGSGTLGAGFLDIVNEGTILADQSNSLTVRPASDGTLLNTGTLRADNGATLILSNGMIVQTDGMSEGQVIAAAGSTVDLQSVTVSGGKLLGDGTLRAGGSNTLEHLVSEVDVVVPNAGQLSLIGDIDQSAIIALQGSTAQTNLIVVDGEVHLKGGGTISMANDPQNGIRGGTDYELVPVLVNVDNTIRGGGNIGQDNMGFVNQGRVEATASSTPLYINTLDSEELVNTGVLAGAANGLGLHIIDSTVRNAFEGIQGTLVAESNGQVTIESSSVTGGTVRTESEGYLDLKQSHLSDLVFDNQGTTNWQLGASRLTDVIFNNYGTLNLQNGANVTLDPGTYRNYGTWNLAGNTVFTNLKVGEGMVVLDGGGTLLIGNDSQNQILGTGLESLLVIQYQTVAGSSALGADSMGIENYDTIAATGSIPLTVDASELGLLNAGVMRAEQLSTLIIKDSTVTNYQENQGEVTPVLNVSGADEVSPTFGTLPSDRLDGVIRAENGGTVSLQSVDIWGGRLESDLSGVIQVSGQSSFLDVIQSANMFVLNGTTLSLEEYLENTGQIFMQGNTVNTYLLVNSPVLSLFGGGQIHLGNDPQNVITSSEPGYRLINEDNTIRGGGIIGSDGLDLENFGEILADVSYGLTLDPSDSGGFYNANLIRATNGSQIRLQDGLFDQSFAEVSLGLTGRMVIEDSAGFTLNQVMVRGGSLELWDVDGDPATTGSFDVSGNSELESVTLQAPLRVFNGVTLSIRNSLDNQQAITLLGSTVNSQLQIRGGDVQLTGGGTIRMANDPQNVITGQTAGVDRLINVDNTIIGSGSLGNGVLGIINRGRIEADGTIPLTVDADETLQLVNSGQMIGSGTGGLIIANTDVTNHEGLSQGLIEANGGGLVEVRNSRIAGGKFRVEADGQGVWQDGVLDGVEVSNVGQIQVKGNSTLNSPLYNAPDAELRLQDGATLNMVPGSLLDNQGTVHINGSINHTQIVVGEGSVVLDGGGRVTSSNDPQSRVLGTSEQSHLINENNIMSLSGYLGQDTLQLTNRATIEAAQSLGLTIDTREDTALVNTGILRATNGSRLTIQNSRLQNYEGASSGSVMAESGSTVVLSQVELEGGKLQSAETGTIDISGTTRFQVVENQARIDVLNGAKLELINSLDNSGIITLLGTTTNTEIRVASERVELIGSGEIVMSPDPQNLIRGVNGNEVLINQDNMIRGGGHIGADTLGLENFGVIRADTGYPLTLDPAEGMVFGNAGLMEVMDASRMVLQNGVFQNVVGTSSPGRIEVRDGGRLELNNVHLSAGEVRGVDNNSDDILTGKAQLTGSNRFEDILLDLPVEIMDGASLEWSGNIVNERRVQILGGIADTQLLIDGLVTLQGSGEIFLRSDPQTVVKGVTPSAVLVNQGNTIRGGGNFGGGALYLQNEPGGTILGDTSYGLIIDLYEDGFLENRGSVKATGSGGLTFRQQLVNEGLVQVDNGSRVTVDAPYLQQDGISLINGRLMSSDELRFTGGVWGGNGTIEGNVFNDTFLSPGDSIGTLRIEGSLEMGTGSIFHAEIGGFIQSADYDYLQITGNAQLGGVFYVSFPDLAITSSLSFSDTFYVLSAGEGISGTFSNVFSGERLFTGNGSFAVYYGEGSPFAANYVVLTDFDPIPEPRTYAMMFLGGLIIAAWHRRRRKRND